jgi:hypothetical protein
MKKFLIVGERAINLDLVALIERPAPGKLKLHFALPQATTVPGVTLSGESVAPAASDHFIEIFHGKEADHIWNQIIQA